jgi:8-oxo-dGTP pyrophosphatase MutT (NUDIX family)
MVYSSGVIIIDNDTSLPEPHVLCVRAYANWDFPKGHIEEGENLIGAAVRETEEETTLTTADYSLVGLNTPSITYGSGKKKKTVTYFLADRTSDKDPYLPVSEELGKPENDEWRWIPASKLSEMMPKRLSTVVDYVEGWVDTINVERK